MNQDQVKERLLELRSDVEEFSVIFSGKTSKLVNGLYKPETREIIIHNKNFESDNALFYTAIHEFAHHVHYCSAGRPVSNRAHTVEFRSTFHSLLLDAEAKGIYENLIEGIPELQKLSQEIRKRYLSVNGELMKDFGQALMEAEKLCRKYQARFEDFIERSLQLPKQTASTVMKIKALDLPAELGYDNMKTLSTIRNQGAREEAIKAFLDGETPDQVKQTLSERPAQRAGDPRKKLAAEKKRIEKTLETLNKRLMELESQLEELGPEPEEEIEA